MSIYHNQQLTITASFGSLTYRANLMSALKKYESDLPKMFEQNSIQATIVTKQ